MIVSQLRFIMCSDKRLIFIFTYQHLNICCLWIITIFHFLLSCLQVIFQGRLHVRCRCFTLWFTGSRLSCTESCVWLSLCCCDFSMLLRISTRSVIDCWVCLHFCISRHPAIHREVADYILGRLSVSVCLFVNRILEKVIYHHGSLQNL